MVMSHVLLMVMSHVLMVMSHVVMEPCAYANCLFTYVNEISLQVRVRKLPYFPIATTVIYSESKYSVWLLSCRYLCNHLLNLSISFNSEFNIEVPIWSEQQFTWELLHRVIITVWNVHSDDNILLVAWEPGLIHMKTEEHQNYKLTPFLSQSLLHSQKRIIEWMRIFLGHDAAK